MRKIAVFTGTRAEFALLEGLMKGIRQREDCCLCTVVSGSHLAAEFGNTVEEIRASGIKVDEIVPLAGLGGDAESVCAAIGEGLPGYARVLEKMRPDILVVLGDRFEALAIATAATICRVPLAHLYGGEATEGLIDESFRHSITKMSHLHFTSCEPYRQRVIQLGEHPDRVFNAGSLGVENIQTLEFIPEFQLRKDLQIDGNIPYLLCTFHPVTLEAGQEISQLDALLHALDAFPEHCIIFTGANADPGGSRINEALQQRVSSDKRYRFFMSLGQRRYLSAARYAACVIGNSSSGIIEVPSLGTPVIDIGNRQKGRIRAESVLHCEADADAIASSIAKALEESFSAFAKQAKNPYQKNGTAKSIVDIICAPLPEAILQKKFFDLREYT